MRWGLSEFLDRSVIGMVGGTATRGCAVEWPTICLGTQREAAPRDREITVARSPEPDLLANSLGHALAQIFLWDSRLQDRMPGLAPASFPVVLPSPPHLA